MAADLIVNKLRRSPKVATEYEESAMYTYGSIRNTINFRFLTAAAAAPAGHHFEGLRDAG